MAKKKLEEVTASEVVETSTSETSSVCGNCLNSGLRCSVCGKS